MYKSFTSIVIIIVYFISFNIYADSSNQYTQKTLPSGDVETTFVAADGSKVLSVKHKDGSVETITTSPNGAKSITKQNKDGIIESHTSTPH